MNEARELSGPFWSRRRWGWTVGVLVAAHVALIAAFASRTIPAKPVASSDTAFRLAVEPIPDGAFDPFFAGDPTLFVSPHPEGFSGAAWREARRLEYRMPEWSEPPQWLSIDSNTLARVPQSTNEATTVSLLLSPEHGSVPDLAEFAPLPEVRDGRPVLRIDGDLAARVLERPEILPTWVHSEPLLDSVVQVGVGDDGEIVSARLSMRSGLAAADERALELVRNLRFEPRGRGFNSSDVTWGRVFFHWRTTPPATNGAAGTAASLAP